jgi:hypothetical protein
MRGGLRYVCLAASVDYTKGYRQRYAAGLVLRLPASHEVG